MRGGSDMDECEGEEGWGGVRGRRESVSEGRGEEWPHNIHRSEWEKGLPTVRNSCSLYI